ncbi:hypothetical protein F0562_001827 [Nyssa sinensis]|uniref:PPC domain-containing protein n=1 Tax=Nyssa sinensis TaxID=561372 RepID=A0A5J5C889_9ASTE|nr:hypothetical protein F0562_001827 [Nyssa sinensis]
MSDTQQEHALAVARLAPRLAALRIELCPGYMKKARALLTQELQNRTKARPGQDWSGRGTSNSINSDSPHEKCLSVPSNTQSEYMPLEKFAIESPTSIVATDFETEKHPISSTEIQIVDKSVAEEGPVNWTNTQNFHSGSSRVLEEKCEDDGDDWLKAESSEIVGGGGTTMLTENEEDISFSDLEEDDGDVPKSYKKVTYGSDSSTKDSQDWVQLSSSSVDSSKDINAVTTLQIKETFKSISTMADYTGTISLFHSRELSHTSDDEEDQEHSPRTVTPLTGTASGGPSRSKISTNGRGSEITGSTPEAATRKPRGRPPGSKNKPKPPIVVTRESELALKPAVLEISAGSDIIEMVAQFARRRHLGISILSGSGTVSNVTLRHPVTHAPNLTLHGPFNILSLSGSFLGSCSSSTSSSCTFGISLAGAQGQVFGGIVAGKVTATSQVMLVGATFMNPSFHRLPAGEMEEAEKKKTAAAGASEGCSSATASMSVYGVAAPSPLNCQISPDVLSWGPTSRQTPPY